MALTKESTYALTLSPVAMSLEELLPSNHGKSRFYAIAIRSALAISTLLVGLAIPFFGKHTRNLYTNKQTKVSLLLIHRILAGLVMSLIGSFLTMLIVS